MSEAVENTTVMVDRSGGCIELRIVGDRSGPSAVAHMDVPTAVALIRGLEEYVQQVRLRDRVN